MSLPTGNKRFDGLDKLFCVSGGYCGMSGVKCRNYAIGDYGERSHLWGRRVAVQRLQPGRLQSRMAWPRQPEGSVTPSVTGAGRVRPGALQAGGRTHAGRLPNGSVSVRWRGNAVPGRWPCVSPGAPARVTRPVPARRRGRPEPGERRKAAAWRGRERLIGKRIGRRPSAGGPYLCPPVAGAGGPPRPGVRRLVVEELLRVCPMPASRPCARWLRGVCEAARAVALAGCPRGRDRPDCAHRGAAASLGRPHRRPPNREVRTGGEEGGPVALRGWLASTGHGRLRCVILRSHTAG